MRLIDADALYKEVTEKYKDITAGSYPYNIVAYDMARLVKNAPTVDAIVPPCKVGDVVYAIARWHGNYVIREVKVCNYTIFDNEWKIVDPYGDYWSVNNFGKTVFPTKEEAERALAERRERDEKGLPIGIQQN